MKQLAIVVPNGMTTISSLGLSVEVIETANQYWRHKGRKPRFEVKLVSSRLGKTTINDYFSVKAHSHLNDIGYVDLILIPALGDNLEHALQLNRKEMVWVANQYHQGSEIATLCTGAFLLAEAGLLDGKQCSTHWTVAGGFKLQFPGVRLAIERIITDERGLYTSGGALSSVNLLLYLVEKYYSRETAVYCAKLFGVELDRKDQAAFIIFSGQKTHQDEPIKKAQIYIEKNVEEKINMESLSAKLLMERRSFDRRFKKATGDTPVEYMQKVKIEAAKKFLESSDRTVNEVMYEVGYTDSKAFRDVFKKVSGLSPTAYRNKFSKLAEPE